jgi:hypothetical protein
MIDKPRHAKLNMDIYAQRRDPESWIEINSQFTGKIVAEDKEYVILSNSGVEVRVKKSHVTEVEVDNL